MYLTSLSSSCEVLDIQCGIPPTAEDKVACRPHLIEVLDIQFGVLAIAEDKVACRPRDTRHTVRYPRYS